MDITGGSLLTSDPRIATRYATPLADISALPLGSLFSTCLQPSYPDLIWWTCVRRCRAFRDATAARKWRLHWWDKSRFRSVLRRCAASGNPEPPRHPTAYILGLEEFRNRRRKASGLWYVCCAMEHGHAAAAYMIGTITLHDSLRSPDGGVEQALERLDWLSPMASVRGDAVSVMRMLTMPPDGLRGSVVRQGRKVVRQTAEAWDRDDERWFCSLTHEYCKFIGFVQ
ncbi:hypothetical protein HU200_022159 [Digitaria exilis]|uniref:At2g35280-like TPR domain-containing protein n=1 Tax=Digitaria exilis TaxID=1010633 RepID=A0A835CE78_9POAL|nr:hypothetical protein HU200_022159 [Digitaria exilis]